MLGLGSDFSHVRAASDEKRIIIDKVETDTVTAERTGKSRGSVGTGRDKWILVEIAYEVFPDPASKEKTNYLEEATFKVNVEARAGEGDFRSAPVAILTAEVTYMNLPFGKGYASFYISPDAAGVYRLDRFLSQCNINAQALIGGQVVDSRDKRKDEENWYSRSDYKVVPGVVMLKNQTPFILWDTDRYPVIKPKQ